MACRITQETPRRDGEGRETCYKCGPVSGYMCIEKDLLGLEINMTWTWLILKATNQTIFAAIAVCLNHV